MASPSLIDDLGDEGCALRELRVMILATEEVAIGGGGWGVGGLPWWRAGGAQVSMMSVQALGGDRRTLEGQLRR